MNAPFDTKTLIEEIDYGTPASKANLLSGDIVVSLDGKPVGMKNCRLGALDEIEQRII